MKYKNMHIFKDFGFFLFERRFLGKKAKKMPSTSEALKTGAKEAEPKKLKEKDTLLKAKAARERLKLELEEQKKLELDRLTGDLMKTKISTIRRSEKFNPDKWNPNSEQSLEQARNEWKALGLPINNPFYRRVFRELRKSFDTNFLNQQRRRSPEIAKIYSDPLNNLDKLNQCDDDFASSVRFFQAIKTMVLSQDVLQMKTEKKIREGEEDPIFSKAIEVVQDNGVKFREAIKNRDYSTAAVYIVGLYAMYKAYKTLDQKKQSILKKAFFWSAAAYAGTVFAKNAGYDVLKKIGLKEEDAEVEGTPLSAIYRVGVPEINELKNLDTFKALSFVNLRSLYGKFEETNDPKLQFIDPASFPSAFPEFRGMRPEDIEDNTYKSKDYHRVGHEIYILVKAMKTAYDKKFKPKTNMSFEEALDGPVLKYSTVFDFMIEINDFYPKKEVTSLFAKSKAAEDAENRMEKVLGMRLSFNFEGEISPGLYEANVMSYPIVIRREVEKNRYLIFTRDVYEREGGNPAPELALAKVPFEGPAVMVKQKVKNEISKGMKKRLDIFKDNSKGAVKFEGDLTFGRDGYWYTKMQFIGQNLIKGGSRPVEVRVKPGEKGNALNITNLQNSTILYIDNVTDLSSLRESLVLASFVSQSDFRLLKWIYITGDLKFIDKDPSGKSFEIRIDGVSELFKINFDGDKYEFKDGKTAEKKLLDQYDFRNSLMESLGNLPRMEKAISNLERLVEQTPEAYFTHFFKSIPKWFTEMTWDYWTRGIEMKDITGPVAKNYFINLLEAQKELVLAKVSYALKDSTDLSEASDKISAIVPYSIRKFEDFYNHFSKLNTINYKKGKKFDEEAFDSKILDELAGVGIQSEDYRHWYKKFTNATFLRYGKDDLREGRAIEAGRAVSIFAFYTAVCDDPSSQGADTSLLENSKMSIVNSTLANVDKRPSPPDNLAVYLKKEAALKNIETSKEFIKVYNYSLYSKYVNYVSWKLDSWITSERTMPIGPTNALGIKSFENFKNSPVGAVKTLVDTTPRLEMSSDYITFDEYLNLSPDERSSFSKEDVILPRNSCTLVFKGEDDLKLFFDIGGSPEFEDTFKSSSSRVTEFEEKFEDKMTMVLNELQMNYTVFPRKFDELRNRYSLKYKTEVSTDEKANEVTIKYTPSELVKEAKRLEQIINKAPKTVTGTYQESLINDRIAEIVRETILHKDFFDTYFNRTTIPRTISDIWEDIKAFIFGR